MNSKKSQDLKFGSANEKKLLEVFRQYFKSDTINKTTDCYDQYDYIDTKNKIIIELKSRRIRKLQYPDTMIGLNKITEGFKHIKNGYTVYLCWSYTDGLSFYELTKDTYNTNWERMGGRWDRGINERCMCCFIPTNIMTDIN